MPAFLWTNSRLADIAADLATIKASHIDVIYAAQMGQVVCPGRPTPATDAEMLAYLDALDAAGLQAMLDVLGFSKYVVSSRPSKPLTTGELATITAYVDKWKSHPAVWGWYADDEGGAEYPVATRQQLYNAIKAAHPAGQVVETHWLIGDGYSPDVHDVFAMDAGPPTGSYVYYYDDHPPYGCVDLDNGSLSLPDNEWSVLAAFKLHLDTLRAQLVAAGETQYMLCMQAFGQGWAGAPAQVYFAMPPPGGISRMWAAAQQAGWDAYGVGWFLWHSDDAYTMPAERLVGIGNDAFASEHEPQRSEVAAIAKTFTSAIATASEPTLPTYCVNVAGEDVTELVDLDTLHRSMSERGEASATIDIPVASENEVPVNGLTRDAAVEIVVDGEREWLGHVVAVHKPKPQDLSYTLDCAGGWDTLHHCAPWCKGFVETRYDQVVELSAATLTAATGILPSNSFTVDTDGQILVMCPKGEVLASPSRGTAAGYYLFSGMRAGSELSPDSYISRVTFDWITAGDTTETIFFVGLQPSLYTAGMGFVEGILNRSSLVNGSGSIDYTADVPNIQKTLLIEGAGIGWGSNVFTPTSDTFLQIRNLRIYVDRTTAPRVDEIVAAIDADVRPDAPTASTEAIGSPLTAFMLDPFMTPAEGIAVALTKAAVPPLCGIIQNQLVIKNRPTAPPDATRLWTVSEQLTPGLEWGVEVDEEQSVDYVVVAYNTISDLGGFPDGTPRIARYPDTRPNDAARTALIDGGDLTMAEAAFYGQQGYYYLHKLVSGPVTIPYVVRDANGAERPADVIRAWDWVQNVGSLDAATAGPFLVSEVEHQGHIATLTIGAAEAYAYNGPERMPTKGRYVGAHRVRTRTTTRVSFAKYWAWKHRKDKKKPKMPRHHARYGTIRGWKWQDVEGRYV